MLLSLLSKNINTQSNINHQLSNEGCKCPLCQKIQFTNNLVVNIFEIKDLQSEQCLPQKDSYLQIINNFPEWEKYQRHLRICLPEICVYVNQNPDHLIFKNKETAATKIIRSKSKLNMFQIQKFFIEGYILHNPSMVNKKKQRHNFSDQSKKECVILARYINNHSQMLTLTQLESLFKSKHKNLRDSLMYLQTLVGGMHYVQHRIKIDLQEILKDHIELYHRAKRQVQIIVGELKITDQQYHSEKHQIHFEQNLKRQGIQQYLIYLSLKIIFLESKRKNQIIQESMFKYIIVKGCEFLWGFKIISRCPSANYWHSAVTQALQYKLRKTMSMMELTPENQQKHLKLSSKAQQMSQWLEKSTSQEWQQMRIIRNRLQKLESEKKSLLESQKQSMENRMNNSFKIRSLRRRESINPQRE